jgi:hypothetical protein
MPLSTLEGVNVLDNFTYMQERTTLDVANIGYYKTELANGVSAELSATNHVGIVQYTYPENTERHILVDVSHMLPSSGEAQHSQFYSNGFLARNSDGSKYQGYGAYRGGFSSRKQRGSLNIRKYTHLLQVPMDVYTSAPSLTKLRIRCSSSPDNTQTHTGQTAPSFALRCSPMQNPSSGINNLNMDLRGG